MELDSTRRFGGVATRFQPNHINPPASKLVLERLAESLILPVTRAELGIASGKRETQTQEAHSQETLAAYKACTEIIRKHSKSFYFSARLLPATKRQGIMALYAFCRTSDDLVDAADTSSDRQAAREQARFALDQWASLTSGASGVCDAANQPVASAWADTRSRFGIPAHLAEELLSGIRMDLTIDRYETWDALWVYCYRVASTVGLMSMYVTGADTIEAIPYAVQLGVALQLTNILRDIGEDARAGRVYLPAEDLARFNYTEEMLLDGVVNSNFVRLMEFQIARAHALYEAALPGIAMLPRDSRIAIAAAATVYRGILDKVRAARYDVFRRRAHLSMSEKLASLPSIWLTYRR